MLCGDINWLSGSVLGRCSDTEAGTLFLLLDSLPYKVGGCLVASANGGASKQAGKRSGARCSDGLRFESFRGDLCSPPA
ncbi:hypothetical protein E2C01_093826 [Portunus trituberculatus]|uniref:Uncharacterized protein n=1 Tax=Portunus trituberculatus TaxID=210409 RepID=A0A5B7JV92_PORTR|nr:hypothetical protein [Portunus trituberculatus]